MLLGKAGLVVLRFPVEREEREDGCGGESTVIQQIRELQRIAGDRPVIVEIPADASNQEREGRQGKREPSPPRKAKPEHRADYANGEDATFIGSGKPSRRRPSARRMPEALTIN
ncbi:MAG TPA: hypothetical protein VGH38_15230 [Bryobacteraceae bacterium]